LSKYVERELCHHSQLSHPFVIGFKRVFYTEDFLVFVLEYASEGSVERFQWPAIYEKRKPLAIYFFQQLIAAVKYCHEHEIVHRDLKHENSLLHMAKLPSGNKFLALKVADFGMCKAAMHSDPKTRVGTIPYMSPVRLVPCLMRSCLKRAERIIVLSVSLERSA
jgi:serine/threonine protein kinase